MNLEFVSANPTGPIHIGGVRWAAVGDALGRIMEMAGAAVTREYYFNDHGAQIDRFSRSLLASAKGEPAPEDGYGGEYIHEIAAAVVAKAPQVKDLSDEEAQEVFRAEGVEMMFEEIKKSLHEFGVDFDVYFHENNLHRSGAVDRAIARLRELGNVYEQGLSAMTVFDEPCTVTAQHVPSAVTVLADSSTIRVDSLQSSV